MRKILLAIDPQKLNYRAIDFACYIANLTKSKLTGEFLENLLFEEMRELAISSSYGDEIYTINERNEKTENNIRCFRKACEKRGVLTNLHRKRGTPTEEIIKESRFADMIIVDPEMSFKTKIKNAPSDFVKRLLEEAECPVIVSPGTFDGIDEIVFTYNSSCSSVFAIKQFTYLFPQFHDKKITLLEVNKENEIAVRAKPKISEWLKTHYEQFNFEVLYCDPSDELLKYVLDKQNLLLVMGAFGRGTLSSLLTPSRAKQILKIANFPMFIAH